jgi:hypothetical protein
MRTGGHTRTVAAIGIDLPLVDRINVGGERSGHVPSFGGRAGLES